ncbi:unnamed protein product [Cyclocybe aegerita]|uniref:Uncharacterized protein n=1 Tax=Cyclocybe aegerita TaxID=1973307 RepID=A0A8S0W897_CYCAE|nr:unnamed protein product [Cyclocybe aegerita]
MPPLPSRKSLEAMKRVDLQKICKDYGVKANLKSEALIDLLLDTQSTPAPPPQPTRRSVSTRLSSRAGPSRVSSMIVHDISEGDEEDRSLEDVQGSEAGPEKPPSPPPEPPRTRKKAKELQTRLGVGKPVIAGGSGPRAVTRSSGSSRGKRAKSSRSMKPREATIEEEPEPPTAPLQGSSIMPDLQEAESMVFQQLHPLVETLPPVGNVNLYEDARKLVDDAIRPLQEQIQALKSELSESHTIKSEIAALKSLLADFTKTQTDMRTQLQQLSEFPSIVLALKDEIRQLREATRTPSQPSTPKAGPSRKGLVGLGPPPVKLMAAASHEAGSSSQPRPNPTFPHPGVAESTLGKRHRDSTSSVITGVIEEGEEGDYTEVDLAKQAVRPTKKRPKLSTDDNGKQGTAQRSMPEPNAPVASSSKQAVPPFTVFRGSEEPSDYIDPPPPTEHLPDFFEPDAVPSTSQGSRFVPNVATSSANAEENQPFNFAFAPIASTPSAMYLPTFPYPDPPQSPSPAGPSQPMFSSRHQDERTDIFKTFGLPSPVRSTRHYGALTQDERGVNPAALTQGSSSSKRDITSNDVAIGLGLTAVRTASSTEPPSLGTDQPTIKRTMFGTELEADTRFGDFGVEGVASGFWSTKF